MELEAVEGGFGACLDDEHDGQWRSGCARTIGRLESSFFVKSWTTAFGNLCEVHQEA